MIRKTTELHDDAQRTCVETRRIQLCLFGKTWELHTTVTPCRRVRYHAPLPSWRAGILLSGKPAHGHSHSA